MWSPGRRPPELVRGCASSHRAAPRESVLLPFLAIQHLFQYLHGVPYVGVPQVKRRQPEPQDFRLAVVADDAACNQRLHDLVAIRVAEADVAAALRRVAGGYER